MKEAGYEAAFATIPRKVGTDEFLEIERIGVYSISLWKLQWKAAGVAAVARRFGVPVA